MQDGENVHALHKQLELVRFVSVLVLLVHFYSACYPAVRAWGLSIQVVDKLIFQLSKGIPALGSINGAKLISLLLLLLSLLGSRGKKNEKLTLGPVLYYLIIGLLLFFISTLFLELRVGISQMAELYIAVTSLGYLSILAGGARMSRLLKARLGRDVFNDLAETFPQEERLISNEYSINLPTRYNLNGKERSAFINIINPFRALLIAGTPGSGKSYFVIRHVITQHIEKGFTLFLYDFKFPDLTLIAYNSALKNMAKYPKPPRLYLINFEDLSRSHRCNPLYPENMLDITDATESSRSILLGLNKTWIQKTGDFFVESPINFLTALFWFLKKYKNGVFCTLPHAIELAQVEYDKLFPILSLEPEIEVLINPFISAHLRGANEQLEGQIASAKISLARLVSPTLYFVMSGNDFNLDVNDPSHPKIVCAGNNPSKTQTYGAVLSLYTERMLKLVNKKKRIKCGLVFDEYPTIYADLSSTISTGRSNLIAVSLAVQDLSQIKRDYGREHADAIVNVCGNVISGQVLGETAKMMSDRIGKIIQERESLSINSNDTSISKSYQLDSAVPASKISALSSGQFVGAVADDPTERIKLKAFYCEVINDHEAIRGEERGFRELPVIRNITQELVMDNYFKIKRDIQDLVEMEMNKINSAAKRYPAPMAPVEAVSL